MSLAELVPPVFEPAQALDFVLAGNARVTARSEKTGKRFTYRVKKADDAAESLWFVGVLTGADNENDYKYLGTIRRKLDDHRLTYEHGRKSSILPDAPSAVAAKWVLGRILQVRPTPNCSVFHAGRCGRCGRTLTVPESIQSGFGPECIEHV